MICFSLLHRTQHTGIFRNSLYSKTLVGWGLGFGVWGSGFGVWAAASGLIAHFMTRDLRSMAYSCALGGFILYAAGRILVYADRKERKPDSGQVVHRSKDLV